MNAADYLTDFSTTDDALVLASVSSKAESGLLNEWLRAQRRAHPDTKVEVMRLPHGDPSPQMIDELAGKLNVAEEDNGYPLILISNGRLRSQNLQAAGKDEKWLQKQLKARGVSSPHDVYFMSVNNADQIYFAKTEAGK